MSTTDLEISTRLWFTPCADLVPMEVLLWLQTGHVLAETDPKDAETFNALLGAVSAARRGELFNLGKTAFPLHKALHKAVSRLEKAKVGLPYRETVIVSTIELDGVDTVSLLVFRPDHEAWRWLGRFHHFFLVKVDGRWTARLNAAAANISVSKFSRTEFGWGMKALFNPADHDTRLKWLEYSAVLLCFLADDRCQLRHETAPDHVRVMREEYHLPYIEGMWLPAAPGAVDAYAEAIATNKKV